MTTVPVEAPPIRTVAHLLRDLGDIPPHRILLNPPPGQATEADVLWLDDHMDRLCELVDGVLVEKPMELKESFIAGVIIHLLQAFVLPRRLGIVTGEAGMLRLFPNIIRIPDIAFIRRTPDQPKLPNQPVPHIAPTLAIEILSESNTPREMQRKIGEYFAAGTELVWIIDPDARTAVTYLAPDRVSHHDRTGTLDATPALPGFTLSLADLFEQLDLQFEA